MDAATTEVAPASAPATLQSSKILYPPPEVGKTTNGKKLFFKIPEGEGQEDLVVLCDSVAEVRSYIHNCHQHGHITDERHRELCDEIARYSSLDASDPRAHWFRFEGPADGLLCPLIYPRPQTAKPAAQKAN